MEKNKKIEIYKNLILDVPAAELQAMASPITVQRCINRRSDES